MISTVFAIVFTIVLALLIVASTAVAYVWPIIVIAIIALLIYKKYGKEKKES